MICGGTSCIESTGRVLGIIQGSAYTVVKMFHKGDKQKILGPESARGLHGSQLYEHETCEHRSMNKQLHSLTPSEHFMHS